MAITNKGGNGLRIEKLDISIKVGYTPKNTGFSSLYL